MEEEVKFVNSAFEEIKHFVLLTQKRFPQIKDVLMYGSSVNGLSVRGNSDLDLTIIVDHAKDQQFLENQILNYLKKELYQINSSSSEIEIKNTIHFKASFGEVLDFKTFDKSTKS